MTDKLKPLIGLDNIAALHETVKRNLAGDTKHNFFTCKTCDLTCDSFSKLQNHYLDDHGENIGNNASFYKAGFSDSSFITCPPSTTVTLPEAFYAGSGGCSGPPGGFIVINEHINAGDGIVIKDSGDGSWNLMGGTATKAPIPELKETKTNIRIPSGRIVWPDIKPETKMRGASPRLSIYPSKNQAVNMAVRLHGTINLATLNATLCAFGIDDVHNLKPSDRGAFIIECESLIDAFENKDKNDDFEIKYT